MYPSFICPYCNEIFDYDNFFEENPEEEAIKVKCDNCGNTMVCTWYRHISLRCDKTETNSWMTEEDNE